MLEFYPQDPRYYLQNELALRLKRRPHYSLRAFARDLEVSVAALSGFLSNKTKLSTVRIQDFSNRLKLSSEQAQHWQDLILSKNSKAIQEKKKAQLRIQSRLKSSKKYIQLESFVFISNWESFAYLELLGFEKILTDKEISQHLGITQARVQSLRMNLLKLNLIFWNINRWSPTEDDSFVGNETPSKVIQKFHKQILKKAEKALTTQDISQREFRSVVFSMKAKDILQLKKDLNQFWMDQIGKYALPGRNDSVYCFSFQLFNLLKKDFTHD